jgi:hypothetical protein
MQAISMKGPKQGKVSADTGATEKALAQSEDLFIGSI